MDPQLLAGIGRAPVPGAPTPVGTDAREDPRFEALQAEIAKLSTPGLGAIDWPRVAQLGGAVLAEKGKDLLAGSYVAGALTHDAGLPGLAVGLEILVDLVEQFWETMTPPVARLRGRRNAVQWLLDRIDLITQEERWDSIEPVALPLMTQLQTLTQRLDELLRERDEEAPSMRPLRQWLDRLPAQAPEAEPEPQAEAEPTPTVAAAPADGAAPAAAPRAAPAPAPARSSAAPIAAPALQAPDGDLEQALERAVEHLNQLADLLMNADPRDARAYRMSRFANWVNLQALPPASNGQTQIPAPVSQVVDAYTRMAAPEADALDALRFGEAQLPAFPMWLDLQSLCVSALERLGDANARREVEAATRELLARLPGLQALSFASGMPFANGATQEWLAGLASAAPDADADGASPSAPRAGGMKNHDAVVAQARSQAANGELDSAIALLQQAIRQAGGAADALNLRVRMCALMKEHLPGRVPGAFADDILEQVQRHDLAHWDPALALEGLSVAYAILAEDESRQADAQLALRGVARLDAARALQLRE